MTVKVTKFDVVDYLKTKEDIARYLEAVIEENSSNLFVKAMEDIAKKKGMNKISKEIGVTRESLYKSLDGKTKVSFDTIYKILDVLGLKLSIVPKNC